MSNLKTVTEKGTLSSRAMLVDLDCGAWWGRAADMKVSGDVAERNKADQRAGTYMKRLLPRGSSFDDVLGELNSVRALHRRLTLPWKDRGPRIVPSAQFLTYSIEMKKATTRFDKAVVKFLADYPSLRVKAKEFLGKMYDAEQYISADALKSRFYVKVRVLPVPDAGDFRVSLPKEELEQIRKDIVSETQESISYAMEYLWGKVHKSVNRFADRIENGDKTIRQGILDKLKRSCELISRLSLVEDDKLLQIKSQIEEELAKHSAEALRDDKRLRVDVAKKARRIEKAMRSHLKR